MLPDRWERKRGRGEGQGSAGLQRAGAARLRRPLHRPLRRSSRSPRGSAIPASPPATSPWSKTRPSDLGNVTEARVRTRAATGRGAGGRKNAAETGRRKIRRTEGSGAGRTARRDLDPGRGRRTGHLGDRKRSRQRTRQTEKTELQNRTAEYEEFLKESHFTAGRRQRPGEAPDAQQQDSGSRSPKKRRSRARAKSRTTTKPPRRPSSRRRKRRDIRVVINKDKAKVEAAKAALEKDDSPKSWKKVAKKYSERPDQQATAACRQASTEESARQEPLKRRSSTPRQGELEGPSRPSETTSSSRSMKIDPGESPVAGRSRSADQNPAGQQAQQEAFAAFVADFQSKWKSRTFCASAS